MNTEHYTCFLICCINNRIKDIKHYFELYPISEFPKVIEEFIYTYKLSFNHNCFAVCKTIIDHLLKNANIHIRDDLILNTVLEYNDNETIRMIINMYFDNPGIGAFNITPEYTGEYSDIIKYINQNHESRTKGDIDLLERFQYSRIINILWIIFFFFWSGIFLLLWWYQIINNK